MGKCKFLFIFLLLFFSSKSFAYNRYGGTLIASTSSSPKSFNPIIAEETSTTLITGFIFEGLTTIDPQTFQIKPDLAKSWQCNSSGKIWIFHLRKDVLWNDGTPFTANDVVFTFNDLIYNPNIPTSSRDIFTIEGKKIIVKKINRYTVEFILPHKFAPFLKSLSQPILPEHILLKAVKKNLFNFSMGLDSKPSQIVGTGPFMLDRFRPGEWVILKKNPYYWKKNKQGNRLPYLNRIVFLIIPDENMALLKFERGEIDVIGLTPENYLILKSAPFKGEKFYNLGPSLASEFITFNQNINSPIPKYKIEWFRNKWFRKAVSYAINRTAIINNIYAGFGTALYGPLDKSVPQFYNPDITKYPYSLTQAKKCLYLGGFRYGENGLLYDSTGHQVHFSLLTNSNDNERIEEAIIIINSLEKLGMKINFLPVEFNSLVTRLDGTKNWEAIIIGLTGDIDPYSGQNVWLTNGQLHFWNSGKNPSVYPWEKKIDIILEQADREMDIKKRKMLYYKWQKIVSNEVPLVFIAVPSVIYAVNDKFVGFHPTVYGGLFYYIEKVHKRK